MPLRKRFLSLLSVPLAIEVVNVVVHKLLRPGSDYLHWLDIVSTAVSVSVVFFVGWTVARALNSWRWAIAGALIIWTCAVLMVVVIWTFESVFLGTLTETDLLGMKGFLFSAIFSFAIVTIVAAIAALIAMRTDRSKV